MNIDTEQISCFLEVARLLSFTKASNVLYLSQSAVSRKVAALEEQLNVKLIRRGKREIKLTAAGEDFQKFFQEYHSRLFSLQRIYSNIIEGRISFGIFHGCNLMDSMGNFVTEFQNNNPEAEILGNSGDSTTLTDGLRLGQFDFIIGLKEPFEIQEDFVTIDICEVHRAVIFSIKNPLAANNELSLRDFENQPYYAFTDEKTSIELSTNKKIFGKYQITPKIKMLNNIDSIIMALNRGTGYILLDERQRIMTNSEFKHLILPETQIISLSYRKNIDKRSAKYKFIESLAKNLKIHNEKLE